MVATNPWRRWLRTLSRLRPRWRRASGSRPRAVSSPVRLALELLEDRVTPATLTVDSLTDDTLANLADDGKVSLREALQIANNPSTTMFEAFVTAA